MSWVAFAGESSKRAARLRNDGDFAVKAATVDDLFLAVPVLRVLDFRLEGWPDVLASLTGSGVFSGENEGNEVKDSSS